MKFRLEKKRKKVTPPSKLAVALGPWRVQLIVGVIIATCIGLLVTGLWYGTRIASLQITSVEAVGGQTIPNARVSEAASGALVGSYYRLVPYRFAWWYPKEQVAAAVMAIPRVKQVYQEREGQTLRIAFEEYSPVALWCTSEDTDCVFLDRFGYAFAAAPELQGSALVRYSIPNRIPAVGESPFAASYMETTTSLATQLEDELALYITHIIRADDVDTVYRLATGAEIKVSERMTALETFENLETIFANEDFEALHSGTFAYIDLRFGDKVFVSEVAEPTATTSSSTEASAASLSE